MFLPIKTDRRLRRTPWVNYAIILTNIVIYMLFKDQIRNVNVYPGFYDEAVDRFPVYACYLQPDHPSLYQFITSAFLHASIIHLFGNMMFLFVFGNAVEDRLGRVGYLGFYLTGAVVSGLGHVMTATVPALGASGAVAAVTGAYLVLMPRSFVTLVYWFIFFIGAIEIPSMFAILFYVIQDLVFYLADFGGVAYVAHLSGYAIGFATAYFLLASRLLPRERFDLLGIMDHKRRRRQFAAQAEAGYQPWEYARSGEPPKQVRPDEPNGAQHPQRQRIMELRQNINAAISDHRLGEAAKLYCELIEIDSGQVLGMQPQRDVASQLMQEKNYEFAARTYELLLNSFPRCPRREEVELILGLIYTRYIRRRQRALELLRNAARRSSGDDEALAKKLIAEIDNG